MFNVAIGLLLGVLGVAMLTLQFGWGEHYAIFRYLLPIAVILIGLWMVLREQGRLITLSLEKRQSAEENKSEEKQAEETPHIRQDF